MLINLSATTPTNYYVLLWLLYNRKMPAEAAYALKGCVPWNAQPSAKGCAVAEVGIWSGSTVRTSTRLRYPYGCNYLMINIKLPRQEFYYREWTSAQLFESACLRWSHHLSRHQAYLFDYFWWMQQVHMISLTSFAPAADHNPPWPTLNHLLTAPKLNSYRDYSKNFETKKFKTAIIFVGMNHCT